MSTLTDFWLNGPSSVVRLELLEFIHPDFSKVWRIVRNAVNGVTVTLEDASSKTFDYYPVKIAATGSNNDLDQSLEVTFGDLGQILPKELDRMVRPAKVVVNPGACIGAWVDGTGQLVADPFLIGNGGYFFVPYNATALQVGMNDTFYSDNQGHWAIAINGGAPSNITPTNKPWTVSGGLNAAYPYTATAATGPVQRAVTGGTLVLIAITLTAGLSPGSPLVDGLGDTSAALIAGGPGQWVSTEPLPGSKTKPQMNYRTYKSTDLTVPLEGPFKFVVNTISFKKEGATFACTAPRLNYVATGEIYALDRFPTLNGFL
jgi:hypothetical protein